MITHLHRIVTLITQSIWFHLSGYGGVDRQDILIVGLCLALSALLWTMLSFRAWVPLSILGGGALLYLSDWGMLQLLPRLNISHGQVSSGLWFTLLGRGIALATANGLALLSLGLWWLFSGRWAWRWGIWMVLGGQLIASGLFLDMWLVEPLRVSRSGIEISSEKLSSDAPPIRVVQISDIHMVTYGPREQRVVARVNQLQPDLIFLTGDYLNDLGEQSYVGLRRMMEDLIAPHGIYAVTGNIDLAASSMVSRIFEPAGVRLLNNEIIDVEIHGQRIQLVGLKAHSSILSGLNLMQGLQDQASDRFRILLFHYPDFIELASRAHIDLYLAGHTHGGQVRFPYLGALHVPSIGNGNYVMGRYDMEDTTLFVSRGTGFSAGYEPQVRFRCPPEVVLITLRGE